MDFFIQPEMQFINSQGKFIAINLIKSVSLLGKISAEIILFSHKQEEIIFQKNTEIINT